MTFDLPVGYHRFHKKQIFNYQLNRWHSFGYARFEDMEEAGRRIRNFSDWKMVMIDLAERALAEDRLMNAAFYYRAAEFYVFQEDPEKEMLYDKFIELFYRIFEKERLERTTVPYGEAALPVIRIPAIGGAAKDTVVMHGGFDSYIEEFYSWMRYFSDSGYDVIAFEGPGQGAARKKHGLALDYRWERPAKAVLDHFGLHDVTWLGISMGGYFCFRAAAFEPRIKRVIASGVAYDYMQFTNKFFQWLMMLFFNRFRDFSNRETYKKMKKDEMHRWIIGNLMYISMTETPMEAFDIVKEMNALNLHSELVEQDVLILTGRNDHFIPYKMHKMQVEALINASSVTAKVFTKETQAHNHCQNGNFGLALETMVQWLGEIAG
jgi:pimeloyl-ACP methyl ester carboxylesterase